MSFRLILMMVGVNTLAVMCVSVLAIHQVLSANTLPVIAFGLFWANYILFRINHLRVRDKHDHLQVWWKASGLLATAGVYFAGALWGITIFFREGGWIDLFGAMFAVAIGLFCIVKAGQIQERVLPQK
jgi:hypothetical protein